MKAEDIEEFEELLNDAERWAFVEWDMNFVADIRDKYGQYGAHTYISEAQLEQLERIANWN